MAERRLVVDQLKFSYEGIFNTSELYSLISSWFYEKGYDWLEKVNQEQITPVGKQIRIVLEPNKGITDFYKIVIRMKINFIDIKDIDVEHEGQTLRLSQGMVKIIFDAYVISDWRGQWTNNPFQWFLTVLRDRYFFTNHYKKMENWVESDLEDLHKQITSYLNVFKYNY